MRPAHPSASARAQRRVDPRLRIDAVERENLRPQRQAMRRTALASAEPPIALGTSMPPQRDRHVALRAGKPRSGSRAPAPAPAGAGGHRTRTARDGRVGSVAARSSGRAVPAHVAPGRRHRYAASRQRTHGCSGTWRSRAPQCSAAPAPSWAPRFATDSCPPGIGRCPSLAARRARHRGRAPTRPPPA